MKAISLHQPWATLIALGLKNYETRGWATTHRGPLAIHAAKMIPAYARATFEELPFQRVFNAYGFTLDDLPTGCVLCIANLTFCYRTETAGRSVKQMERDFGNWTPGRYAWKLERVRRFDPIPARGAQALWAWAPPAELASQESIALETYIERMRARFAKEVPNE